MVGFIVCRSGWRFRTREEGILRLACGSSPPQGYVQGNDLAKVQGYLTGPHSDKRLERFKILFHWAPPSLILAIPDALEVLEPLQTLRAAAQNPHLESLELVLDRLSSFFQHGISQSEIFCAALSDRLENFLLLRRRFPNLNLDMMELLLQAHSNCAFSVLRYLIQTEGLDWGQADEYHYYLPDRLTTRDVIVQLLDLLIELDFPFNDAYIKHWTGPGYATTAHLRSFLAKGWRPSEELMSEMASPFELQRDTEARLRLLLAHPEVSPPLTLLQTVVNQAYYRDSFIVALIKGTDRQPPQPPASPRHLHPSSRRLRGCASA